MSAPNKLSKFNIHIDVEDSQDVGESAIRVLSANWMAIRLERTNCFLI